MTVEREELNRRLRSAREDCGMKQEDVARHLGVSRSTIAQMELGNRGVSGLELSKLAYLYGRDIRSFLAEEFREENVLGALFRKHPDLNEHEEVLSALRECMGLGREITNLEGLLGIDRDSTALPSYSVRPPRNKWEAVQQGERIAAEERRRVGLGSVPIPDICEFLEAQGVRTAQVLLPDDLSGLTLADPDVGVLVVANAKHHFLRRRFSLAHEYCHVLADRDQKGQISRASERESFVEVRANAFAASFLMPREGVEEYVKGLAKGRPSRVQANVFDEEEALQAQARPTPGSQSIQIYDVALLANHFAVSRASALYRLKNLKLMKDPEFDALMDQEERGLGGSVAKILALPEPEHEEERNEFRRRFLALGLEAYRRGEISRRKLRSLAAMVGVEEYSLDRIITDTGIEEEDVGSDVLVPEQ